jgi:hypothetical protein
MIVTIKKTIDYLFTYKLSLLLLTLIAQIVIPVFFKNPHAYRLMLYISISMMVIVSMLVFGRGEKIFFHYYLAFIFLVLVFHWLQYFYNVDMIFRVPRLILVGSLYVILFIKIFLKFSKGEDVDMDNIFGAIAGFVLLGMISTFVTILIDIYYPGSFSFATEYPLFQDYLYFTFVTFTTLGYGDISPVTVQGEMHTIIVALAGQLYLTVTIGLIIGRFLGSKK